MRRLRARFRVDDGHHDPGMKNDVGRGTSEENGTSAELESHYPSDSWRTPPPAAAPSRLRNFSVMLDHGCDKYLDIEDRNMHTETQLTRVPHEDHPPRRC